MAGAILAQSDRASIVGVVKDPTGAVVANAKIKVVNVSTGSSFETTTNAEGRYVTPTILRPGSYKVEASAQGFKTATSTEVVLQIGDVKEINLSLQLGATTEQVTVTAEAPELQTETSDRGGVVTGREVTELPLKDRNFTQLATLSTPGVARVYIGILTDATAFNQGNAQVGSVPNGSNSQGSTESSRFSRSGGASISANGLRPTQNNFTLDGVDNNEPQFGTIGVFPNPDAIQEFKVDTSVAKAETGRGGASISTTYQSGTNQFHGSAFYYGQNEALNATHWVTNRLREDEVANGRTVAQAAADLPKSKIRVNEFGFTVGGPIIKNRTFFFGDYLGQRNLFPAAFKTGVPTAKSRVGDFSEFLPNTVTDPLTCTVPGDISSGGCSNFPGNIIPNLQSRSDFSPQALKFLALYPLPTVNILNPNNGGNANYFGVRRNQENINSFDVRIDHRLNNNNNLFGRYSFSNQERVRANFFPKVPTAGFGAGEERGNTRQVAVSDTHVFKPTLLNEVRFGWTQVEIGIFNCGVGGACGISATACQDLGIPNCNKGTLATSGGMLTGGFGTGEFEFSGDGGLFLVKSNNFTVADSVTLITGKHTIKAGVEARPRLLDTIDGGRSGGLKGHLQYQTSFYSQTTGNVQADYLLGRPASNSFAGVIIGGSNPFELRRTEWGMFVQDDWKLTPSLTMNAGLRYELYPAYSEAHARMANWDPTARAIVKATGSGDRLINTDKKNWGPRIGFAYNFGPGHKFVLRTGYGLFYSSDGYDYPPTVRNPPITSSVAFFGGSCVTGGKPCNLTNGPPVAPVVDPPVISPNSSLFVQERNPKTAMINQWNMGVQWEFARDWLLDVAYVASRSRHLLATRQLGSSDNGLGFSRTPTGAVTSTNPNPDTPIGSVMAYENRSSANYDALQAKLERRFRNGLEFRTLYTWSHNIDDSTGVFNGIGETRGSAGGPVNPLNFRNERGNSALDRRHIFSTNLIYDLPFGKGKRFASNAGTFVDKLIGGWQTNVIYSATSGLPFGVEVDAPNGYRTRPSVVGNPFTNLAGNRYLNLSAFAIPNLTATNLAGKTIYFGNLGRNAFAGPSRFNTDLSIFKNTFVGERYRVQFGVEFFNAFNQVAHVVPNNYIDTGFRDSANHQVCNAAVPAEFNPGICPYGRFDNAFPPRTIQYRLKVRF